jgi:hypothetical protein
MATIKLFKYLCGGCKACTTQTHRVGFFSGQPAIPQCKGCKKANRMKLLWVRDYDPNFKPKAPMLTIRK